MAGQESSTGKNSNVFDLNVEITGGKLADQFGNEAYLRITPQGDSTFQGEFTSNFSGGKPRTEPAKRSRICRPWSPSPRR